MLSSVSRALADILTGFGFGEQSVRDAVYADLGSIPAKGRCKARYYLKDGLLNVEVLLLQKGKAEGETVVENGVPYAVKEKLRVAVDSCCNVEDTLCGVL